MAMEVEVECKLELELDVEVERQLTTHLTVPVNVCGSDHFVCLSLGQLHLAVRRHHRPEQGKTQAGIFLCLFMYIPHT
jgi:hypothetical protein